MESPKIQLARDNMLVEFLKKESALKSVAEILHKLNIIHYYSRPQKPHHDIYLSIYQIKRFTERWVKTHREQ